MRKLQTNRFAPDLECLEDRRVLSLLGALPIDLNVPAALAMDGGSENSGLQQVHGLQIAASVSPVISVALQLGVGPGNSGLFQTRVEASLGGGSLANVGVEANLGGGSLANVGVEASVGGGSLANVGVRAGVGGGSLANVGVAASVGGGSLANVGVEASVGGGSLANVDSEISMGSDSGPGIGVDVGVDGGLTTPPPQITPPVLTPPLVSDPGLTATPPPGDSSAITPQAVDFLAGSVTGGAITAEAAAVAEPAPVGYAAPAELLEANDIVVSDGAPAAAVEEAFRIGEMTTELTPENGELLLDPSGLAAADVALQQVLNTLSDLSRAFLNWFAMIGPTPFILMGLAALAAMSEVARWRLQKVRDMRRYSGEW